MRCSKHLLIFLFITVFLSQSPLLAQSYFQQRTDYDIKVNLDTIHQTLSGDIVLNYTNNSTQRLDEIYFHVWWNAFSDKTSAYSQQLLSMNDKNFYFSDEESLGGYEQLEFEYDGKNLEYEAYEINGKRYSDIIVLHLEDGIKAGETVTFSIRFKSNIPYAFSRCGIKDGLYRMTQWYPKPVVFDNEGWHPMPYLEFGEYYSEFGDYNIELNVPANHTVASTGVIDEGRTQYSSEGKKMFINAENVIDFAWFSSVDYVPYREAVTIDDKSIAVNIFVEDGNDKWEKMMTYAKRAVEFYSQNVGPYPYPQVTVVAENSGEGSGMEYPMITLIDSYNSDQVIDHLVAHEIGHNWFQAILASNERRYTWMDEGINSYYEHVYNDLYYAHDTYDDVPFFRHSKSSYSILEASVMTLERANRSLPINLPSEDYDVLTYVTMNYEKMSWSFDYLSHYIGDKDFTNAIKKYYNQWKFKHPSPQVFQAILEEVSGKNLNWFFTDYINSTEPLNLKLGRLKKEADSLSVNVINKGPFSYPYAIAAYDENDELLYEEWYEGIIPDTQDEITIPAANVHKIVINGESFLVDINHGDNIAYVKKPLFGKPINVGLFNIFESYDSHDINILPSIYPNENDGWMIGALLTSTLYPLKNTRWMINPNYGLRSKQLAGLFRLEQDVLWSNKNARKLTLGLLAKTYAYDGFENIDLSYLKFSPDVTFHFSDGLFSNSYLQYKLHAINQDELDFEDGNPLVSSDWSIIHQLNYNRRTRKRLSQNDLLLQLEYEKYNQPFGDEANYLKLSVTDNFKINYNEDSQVHIRFFGGYFIAHTERESSSFSNEFSKASFALASQGFSDHLFEESYWARSGQLDRSASNQVTIVEGGFKNTFGAGFTSGFSNDYLLSTNVKVDLPFSILAWKIRPYMDIALSSTKGVTSDPLGAELFYSGGIAVEISDIIGVYVPLINDSVLQSNYSGTSFLSRISINVSFKDFNIWKVSDDPSLIF
jgi:hypothetical protein